MLTVIVPATDNPPTLQRCLAALGAAAEGPDELIVVDEAPAAGFAAARRAGADAASGDLIAFVDSDVLIHPGALAQVRAAFHDDPSLAAVVGSYDDAPEAPGTVSRFRNLLHHHVHQSSPGAISSFWGGLGAVRRTAFDAVGGFDPDERWLDDVDLGMRLTAAGFRVELRPEIQGTHLKSWTLRSMIWTDFARRGVPWVQLLLRHRTLSSELNLGWRHRASAASSLAAAGALAARRPLPAAFGLGTLVALNRPFYTLLLRRGGATQAAAGVGLHALHHLTAVAALVAGVATWSSRIALGRTPIRSTFSRRARVSRRGRGAPAQPRRVRLLSGGRRARIQEHLSGSIPEISTHQIEASQTICGHGTSATQAARQLRRPRR